MKKRLKINGVIVFIAVISSILFPTIFLRQSMGSFLDEVLSVFGIAFILLGQLFRVSSRGYKSEHSQQGYALIQGGPYTLVRNPMYLGIFLIGLGIVLILFKWWAICIFLLVFIARYILLIFEEEKKLRAIFPKDYQAYQQKVPRIIPSLAMILQKDIVEYLPLKLSWLKKEMPSVIPVLGAVILLKSWKNIRNEGWQALPLELVMVFMIIILFASLFIYLKNKTANGR